MHDYGVISNENCDLKSLYCDEIYLVYFGGSCIEICNGFLMNIKITFLQTLSFMMLSLFFFEDLSLIIGVSCSSENSLLAAPD